jgi:hypothetical protein
MLFSIHVKGYMGIKETRVGCNVNEQERGTKWKKKGIY